MLDLDCMRLTDEQLLVSFHAGVPAARDHLPRRVGTWMVDRAARLAPDLDRLGLTEDVSQAAWEILLRRPPGAYDPRRGGIYAYLHMTLRNAARAVRSAHGVPAAAVSEEGRVAREAADEFAEVAAPASSFADTVVADLEAQRILRLAEATAPADLATALELVGIRDLKWGEAARAVGVSRFTLDRRVRAWRTAVDFEAAA